MGKEFKPNFYNQDGTTFYFDDKKEMAEILNALDACGRLGSRIETDKETGKPITVYFDTGENEA